MFKKLVEHNIISCNGQFLCHLCMCIEPSFEDVLHHINNEKHTALRYKQMFNSKNYSKEIYQELADNDVALIVEHSLICILCQRNIIEIFNTLQHIQGKCHIEHSKNKNINCNQIKDAIQNIHKFKLQPTKFNIFDIKLLLKGNEYMLVEVHKALHNYSNKECGTLINNGIIMFVNYQLLCKCCNCIFRTSDNILQHINAIEHVKKKQNNDSKFMYPSSENYVLLRANKKEYKLLKIESIKQGSNENVVNNINSNISNNKKKVDLIEIQHIQETITRISDTTKIKEKQQDLKVDICKICTSSCNENCLATVQQKLIDNGIIIHGSTDFLCTLCKREIKSLHDILTHIRGKAHKNILRSHNLNLSVPTDCNSTNQTSVFDYSDNAIDIDIDIDQNRNLSTNNMYEAITDYSSEDKNSEILDTKKSLYQNSFYSCELCNMQIDINNLFQHLNTVTHRCNIFSMNIGDDIILYKCFCCKSIMQGNSLLIHHLSSVLHLNNFIKQLKYLKTNNTEIFTLMFSNVQSMLEDTNFPLYAVLVPKVQDDFTYFDEEWPITFDISDIGCYNNIKNNVVYYCLFCSATLNTYHNLIAHCQARMHLWKIKQLFQKQKQFSVNNISAVTEQINNVSVNDKNQNNFNMFHNGSPITSDISAQITKLLSTSPFNDKTSKNSKPKDKFLPECLNKAYDKKYIEIEEEMYNVQYKLKSIKINLRLIIPYNRKSLYCLACDDKVSKEFCLLYEHICLQSHKMQINEMKKDTKSVQLSKEFMKELTKDLIMCYPCKISVPNDTCNISTHINNIMHNERHEMFVKFIDDTFNFISQNVNHLWYSIQRFCCVLCKTNFNYKIKFIEHIIKKHNQPLKNYMFDFCIPCTTLWLDEKDSYTTHCNDIIHKYLIKNQDFMIEDFPLSMKKILMEVDKVSDLLFQQTQTLLNDNVQEEVKNSLENSLKLYFPAIKAFTFGSRVTGLAFENSNVKVYLDCGNAYDQSKNEYSKHNHLISIKNILNQCKEEWEVKEILEEARTPIIKLVHKQSGIHCDISATNSFSVENSKLIRSFNEAYVPCRKLILFIKKWFSYFDLPWKHGLTSYALAWLVIFYLQSESYLPSVATLIKQKNKSRFMSEWEIGETQLKNNDKFERSVSKLLIGFFNFYANFDYQYDIICPLMGQSLAKKAFVEIHMLPKEMKPYINYLNTSKNPEYFCIDSPLCIQDPLDLSHNLTKAVTSITLKYFKQYCQDSESILFSFRK